MAIYPALEGGGADCGRAYGRECEGKLSHFIEEYL